ncbi:MAG: AraC family transcriptional regulator [Ferruginibacter sp.]
MKPELRQITSTPHASFLVRKDVGNKMLNNWHYHPEIELLYLKRSAGTWMVGDHIGPFQSGDIVLIGTNLPHCFRHEYDHFIKREEIPGEAICVKFEPSVFGSQFFDMPESKEMKELLSKCNHGLKLVGKTKKMIAALLEKMLVVSPGKKLVYLLSILDEIAENKEYIALSSQGFIQSPASTDKDKIRLVFEFTFNHYNEKISLDQVAALLNMTKQSFCRYFKTKTKKTYIQFLMEVRIGYACKLLIEDEKNVREISYEAGYNNISHFNHQFKLITKKKPLDYKKDYLKMELVTSG